MNRRARMTGWAVGVLSVLLSVVGVSPYAFAAAVKQTMLTAKSVAYMDPTKGVTLVGPLPREIQKVTVYAAAVTTKSGVQDAAKAFIAFLTAPAARPKFAAVGLDYRE